jgi:hypothetical protein
MAGYTAEGFERKRFDEILSDKNEAQKTALGPDLNLDPKTPDGQISGLLALSDDQLWQIAEFAVNATSPSNATGATLSNLVQINFIERLEASPTLLVLNNVGVPGVTIPAGQIIREVDGSYTAVTTAAFTFDAFGNAPVAAKLTVDGPIEVAPGVFEDIVTPQADWFSTTNPSIGIVGRLRETDAELRLRRARSTGTNSQNMIDSLIGNLANLPGMLDANVIQNRGDTVDSNGLAGHSFEAIVTGGDSNQIAQTIWNNFPFGIGIQGTTSGIAIDKQGILQTVPFTRTTEVPMYMTLDIHKRPGYPADGDSTIKANVVAYADGTLIEGRGFGTGDDVIYTELYTPVNTVPNLDIVDMRVGRVDPPPAGTANTDITLRERSVFDVSRITVTGV